MNEALKLIQHSIHFVIHCLKDPKIFIYFLPGAIVGLIFWEAYFILENIENIIEFVEHIPLIGSFLSTVFTVPINFIQFIIVQLLTFFILTLLSPINTFLSERIEFQLNGKAFPFSFYIVLRDLWRMVRVVIFLVFLEVLLSLTYWLFVGWYNPFDFINETVYFIIASFFYGISFFDYSFERHGMGLMKSLNYGRSNFWLVLFSGFLFKLLFSIPVVGIIVTPVIMTIITTFLFVKQPPKFSVR
jgi:CysZ protein